MKRIVLATALLVCVMQPDALVAADMPVKAIVPVATWTGFYVGLGTGIRSTAIKAKTTTVTENGVLDTCVDLQGNPAGTQCIYDQPLNDTQFRFSFYAGVNFQIDSSVLIGMEVDGGWAPKTTALTGTAFPGGPFLASGLDTDQFNVKTEWDASFRLRAGYIVTPTFLIYATGGGAYVNFSSTIVCGRDPVGSCAQLVPAFTRTSTFNRIGWTAGGGFETKVWRHILFRGEYRYSDFGVINVTENVTANGVVNLFNYDVRLRTHTALLGIAYLFTAGP